MVYPLTIKLDVGNQVKLEMQILDYTINWKCDSHKILDTLTSNL